MEVNVKYRKDEGALLDDPTIYRRLVGSLIYFTTTHPDISYAVYQAPRFIWLPTVMLIGLGAPDTCRSTTDNMSAIQIVANPVFHERTKYIEVDCQFVHDTLERRVISLP
ncbi:uncharacterized protein [Aristolochia californica]|uniref:uncharacterized protein n=1 Tax=Aristolochia californica TaxID=171875 RepID=UPI0035DB3A37